MRVNILFIPILILMSLGCGKRTDDPRLVDVNRRLSKLVSVSMHFDASQLPTRQKDMLKCLVDASKLIHEAFLQQMYPPGVALRDSLAKANDELGKKLYRLVVRNGGPFDKMDEYANFVGSYKLPLGVGVYPTDLTKDEFQTYVEAHLEKKDVLMSPYTVVRRDGAELTAVPYHDAFAEWIKPAAELLQKASSLTDNPSLKKYLTSRADALLTDDYYQADVDWIELKESEFDFYLAPYEVYEDQLMGLKAFYEASIGVVDKEESKRLQLFISHLDALEQNLPYDAKYKRSIKGLSSPMVVVTEVLRTGDAATGYQAVAANLPNDPKVTSTKGTKKIFWKNMLAARVENIIIPVGRQLIASNQVEYMNPDAFLYGVMMHEMCHALGPTFVHGTGDRKSVNQALNELYSPIEEGKATVAGLHSFKYFVDHGIVPKELEKQVHVSHLASIFRSIRFGITEAHSKASMCELNFIRERGGFRLDSVTKKWSVDFERIGPAISDLARVWLTLEATGDYDGVAEFFRRWAHMPKDVSEALSSIEHLPVDFEPEYSIEW